MAKRKEREKKNFSETVEVEVDENSILERVVISFVWLFRRHGFSTRLQNELNGVRIGCGRSRSKESSGRRSTMGK